MHKVHKVMEEKYLCSYTFSYHWVIFFEITQMLNSYSQSDLKKSQSGVCCSNNRLNIAFSHVLKFFEATQELWNYTENVNGTNCIVPLLKVRWKKNAADCTISVQVPLLLWSGPQNLPGWRSLLQVVLLQMGKCSLCKDGQDSSTLYSLLVF